MTPILIDWLGDLKPDELISHPQIFYVCRLLAMVQDMRKLNWENNVLDSANVMIQLTKRVSPLITPSNACWLWL